MKRRQFSKAITAGAFGFAITGVSCSQSNQNKNQNEETPPSAMDTWYQLSLAQWSLNKPIFAGTLSPFAFAEEAKKLGFEGLEYVSGLYNASKDKYGGELPWLRHMSKRLNDEAKAHDMENLLIMIDNEGDLGVQDKAEREKGIANHHKWIDMAQELGCHSIRINLFGDGTNEAQSDASADSMRQLGEYSKDKGVNILVENHGGLSSDPNWVESVMKKANMPNVGVLPDFGNFCIMREGGERWGAPCVQEYPDIYEGVQKMMPYAKAVSAKSYAFDENGDETKIDYYKMIKVVHDAGYKGYIGVEYEGDTDPYAGIEATKNLIIKAANQLKNG